MSAKLQPVSLYSNMLLSALPPDVKSTWFEALDLVLLGQGEHIASSQGDGYVYFPTSAIVSLIYAMDDGSAAEVAVIGNEGLLGVASFMGGEWMLGRAQVQTEGHALRAPSRWIRSEFARSNVVQALLLRYAHALSAQAAQLALCNRYHDIDQQLCRWLLQMLDRLSGLTEFKVTQELIAARLGVRRESVSEGMRRLQLEGLLSHRRGHVFIQDRPGLESRSCACYSAMNGESERLLPRLTSFRRRLDATPSPICHKPDARSVLATTSHEIPTKLVMDGMPALSTTASM